MMKTVFLVFLATLGFVSGAVVQRQLCGDGCALGCKETEICLEGLYGCTQCVSPESGLPEDVASKKRQLCIAGLCEMYCGTFITGDPTDCLMCQCM